MTDTKARRKPAFHRQPIPKTPSGIKGLDEITSGGLPRGRPTLVCGGPGCGKSILAMEFLVRGAMEGEPGIFVSFEETPEELALNFQSLGFDVERLVEEQQLLIEYVRVERSEIDITGEYDLDGLFIRLGQAIGAIGATRVVLDTIESLFLGFENTAILRAELRRLFQWLKDRGVTTIITGERGAPGQLTRQGLEEYVSDCVILLDHRVNDQISTRRLRVVKYRGSVHGTNEYPFLIGNTGMSVLPVTSLSLQHRAGKERVPTGIEGLDRMLGGQGFYRGSSVMVMGAEGTGKTTIAAQFLEAGCRRGERGILFSFEESEPQIMRNMMSVGVDLAPWLKKGLLQIHAARPTVQGLEAHLVAINDLLADFKPHAVIIDPITGLISAGLQADVQSVLLRLVDHMKTHGTTSIFTSMPEDSIDHVRTGIAVSSFIDTLIKLRDLETDGTRELGLVIMKSRGMAHSRSVASYRFSDRGLMVDAADTQPSGGRRR